MTGGQGDDIFVFAAGNDRDFVRDFNNGDIVEISGFDISNFEDVMEHASQTSRGVKIDFGEDELTLDGARLWHLDAEDFLIV